MSRPISDLLTAADQGDPTAAEELLPLLYDELRGLARARIARERGPLTLQPTALVHEAYLRLLGKDGEALHWNGRRHFFAAAAQAMRRILIERARRQQRLRHGAAFERATFGEDVLQPQILAPEDLLLLDDALHELEQHDPTMARCVDLRFFAGLTVPEVALAMEVSERTVNRYWTAARAWLTVRMAGEQPIQA